MGLILLLLGFQEDNSSFCSPPFPSPPQETRLLKAIKRALVCGSRNGSQEVDCPSPSVTAIFCLNANNESGRGEQRQLQGQSPRMATDSHFSRTIMFQISQNDTCSKVAQQEATAPSRSTVFCPSPT